MTGNIQGIESSVVDHFRKAEMHTDRQGPFRKEAYQRLLELAHSDNSAQKIFATSRIQGFFTDFPELQDEAINAIYDLCEDPLSEVRIEGYRSITSISKVDKSWLVRNADVLVQLLQSDEPEEVVVVKHALREHIDMDPAKTFQVLCDQCVFAAEGLDADDLALRARLRMLVINFLTEDKGQVTRTTKTLPAVEETLFSGLLSAIPTASREEISAILRDILTQLPSLRFRCANGDKLLDAVLKLASTSLRGELAPTSPSPTSLPNTQFYIRLAQDPSTALRAGDPLLILQFFLRSPLVNKINLLRLSPDTQVTIILAIAEAWHACEGGACPDRTPKRTQVVAARNQLTQASPVFFEFIMKAGLTNDQARKACELLLSACKTRKTQTDWVIPTNLRQTLQELHTAIEKQKDGTPRLSNLQSSLLEVISEATSNTNTADTNQAKNRLASGSRAPQRASNAVQLRASGSGEPRSQRPVTLNRPSREDTNSLPSRPTWSIDTAQQGSSRVTKRPRRNSDDISNGNSIPSLLSRMEGQSNGNAMHRTQSHKGPQRTPTIISDDKSNSTVADGLQIKGAAAKAAKHELPSTLFERLNMATDDMDVDGADADSRGGRKRRKKANVSRT